MARIFKATSTLQHRDYAVVAISVNNGGAEQAALYRRDDKVYLLSNNGRLNGDDPSRHCDAVSHVFYRYGWVLSYGAYQRPINEVIAWNGNFDCEVRFIGIITDDDGDSSASEESAFKGDFLIDSYSRDNIYTGQDGYHDMCYEDLNEPTEEYKGHRIGVELEVEFNDEYDRDAFNEIESNWFYREDDGSLDEFGCEIITIPLLPKDAKSVVFWRPLIDRLKGEARSWDTGRCGLHVHIGREILGSNAEEKSETIGKLLFMYHTFVKHESMNIAIYGRERGYSDQDAKTREADAAGVLGAAVFRDKAIKDKVKKSLIDRCDNSRYYDINITKTPTIEFRKGRGSINAERIAMVVEYSELMCLYARQVDWEGIALDDFISYLKTNAKNERLLTTINRYY